jgi:energy-coupling factor transporter ATP-binding protein EcfA2
MKLKIGLPFGSNQNLSNIDFPKFTLITGLNGAGKSRLLEIVRDSNPHGTDLAGSQDQIKLFTYASLNPGESSPYNSTFIVQELEIAREELKQKNQQIVRSLNQMIAGCVELSLFIDKLDEIVAAKPATFMEKGLTAELANFIHKKIQQAVSYYEGTLDSINEHTLPDVFSLGQASPAVRKIAIKKGKPAIFVVPEDINLDILGEFSPQSLLTQNIARTFVQYMEADKSRRLREFESKKFGAIFEETLNTAPWDLLNGIFAEWDIPYSINKPDPIESLPLTPVLIKKASGERINLGDLSSGEKILVALALGVYQVSASKEFLQHPKLMLLDEVDALLHPSMIRHFIRIVEKTFVGDLDMHVMATTHSPTTVALAPEESLFMMNNGSDNNRDRIEKVSKPEALNMLTVGVPTLAINFDNRRQVFVEDDSDAKIHQSVFDRIKTSLKSDRTLSFLGAGAKTRQKSTDEHPISTGCEAVKAIVTKLVNQGNTSVWGLVDWDAGKNASSDRLFTFRKGKRHSIENAILDPRVMIVLFHMNHRMRSYLTALDLEHDLPIYELSNITTLKIQKAILLFCKSIIGDFVETDLIEIAYADDASFNIPKQYLHARGHGIQKCIEDIYPEVKSYNKDGGLLSFIADELFRDYPGIIPRDFQDCYHELLDDRVYKNSIDLTVTARG